MLEWVLLPAPEGLPAHVSGWLDLLPWILTAAASVTAAWIAARGKRAAEEARELARPTGNGYAKETTATMQRIELRQIDQHEQVMSICARQDRAIEDLRLAGEDYVRREARELAEIRALIRRHHPE